MGSPSRCVRAHFIFNKSLSDPRVKDWLLMESYHPTIILTLAYLLVVILGPRVMQNRQPLQAPNLLFLYNMFLVGVNFHIFYEVRMSVSCIGEHKIGPQRAEVVDGADHRSATRLIGQITGPQRDW